LDDVVVFEPLSEPAARAIWRREIAGLEQRLALRGLTLRIDVPEDVETICLQQIHDGIRQQGARAVIRLFDRAVADKCLDVTGDGVAGASSFRVERVGEDGLRYSLVADAVL
jgi:ATP-dependent Clp protease ATP-binding subunit ClpA